MGGLGYTDEAPSLASGVMSVVNVSAAVQTKYDLRSGSADPERLSEQIICSGAAS